jgi:hypothetical protein
MKYLLTIVFCCVFLSVGTANSAGQTYRAPQDFDGDGKTDVSIYRPSNGQWWIMKSSDGSHYVLTFGLATDKIVPQDYTGDGKCDIAVWRPSTGEWFILRSEDNSYYSIPFGVSTDFPVPADYDGDGKADVAIRRASHWWIRRSSDSSVYALTFGSGVPSADTILGGADYTGDGKADPAMYSPFENTVWKYLQSENGGTGGRHGTPDLTKVPGDYDGDHKIDIALFNPANGIWTIYRSSGGIANPVFGADGDKPVPNAYVRKGSE